MDGVHTVFHTGSEAGTPVRESEAREILDELFTHSDGVSDLFFEELRETGAILPTPPVRVVTIIPGAGPGRFSMEDARTFQRETTRLVPAFIQADGLFCYLQGALNGIVSAADQTALETLCWGLRQLVESWPPQSRPHAAVSNCCLDIRSVSHACEENHEANAYERFRTAPAEIIVQEGGTLPEGNPEPPKTDDDQFFGKISQKLCNAIIAEDRTLLHRTLDQALDFILNSLPRISAIHMRAIHFCKPLEMVLVEGDVIDRLFVEQFHLASRIIKTENEAELRTAFHREMDAVADYAARRKQMHVSEQMRRVMEYIDENLSDCMLSSDSIARNFRMSQANLTRQFRNSFQTSIPETIHRKRVQMLKQQLTETDKPIRELAMDAGYISIATMNRAFVRIEGVYPGQYRKKMKADAGKSAAPESGEPAAGI